MRICQRLLLGFLPASLLVVAGLGLSSYLWVRAMLLDQIQRQQEFVSSIQADRTTLAVRRNHDLLGLLASRVNMRRLMAQRPPGWENELAVILDSAKHSVPDFLMICLVDAQGRVVVSTQADRVGLDIRDRAWYQPMPRRGLATAMERGADGRFRFVFVHGLEWEGRDIGLMVVHASPSPNLAALEQREGLWDTATCLLMTRDPDLGSLWLNAPQMNGDYSARIPDPADRPLFETLLAQGEGALPPDLRLGGVPVMGHSRVIAGTDWVLASLLHREEALLPLRHLGQWYGALGVCGLILLGGVCVWTSHALTAPIQDLCDEARRLREHPHDTKPGTEGRGLSEFSALGDELHGLTQHLGEIQQRLQNAVEHAANGMLAINPRGDITLVNQAAARMTGYTQEGLLGQNIQLLVPPSSRSIHQELVRDTFADGQHRPLGLGRDLELQRKDGRLIPVEIGLSPIESAGEALILVTLVDLTWRNSVEKEREQLVRDLERRLKDNPGLRGVIHLCASCKKYHRTEDDVWIAIETYLASRFEDARFSHGICPDCLTRLYPEFSQRILAGETKALRNSGESGDPPLS
jgi:PAS domain S-box-containing protein